MVANNTIIKVDTDTSLSNLLEHMLTLDINYKTVTAFLLVAIVKGGKFDLGSTMRISALKQARRTGSSPSASAQDERARGAARSRRRRGVGGLLRQVQKLLLCACYGEGRLMEANQARPWLLPPLVLPACVAVCNWVFVLGLPFLPAYFFSLTSAAFIELG
jgi:hypothetical protein